MILPQSWKQRIREVAKQTFLDMKDDFIKDIKESFTSEPKNQEEREKEKANEVAFQLFWPMGFAIIGLFVLFLLLILYPIMKEDKAWIFLIYVVASLVFGIVGIIRVIRGVKEDIMKEYLKSEFANNLFWKVGMYVAPLPLIGFFSFYFINSVLNIPFFTEIPLKFFDWNIETFILLMITLTSYYSFSAAIPPLVSKEYSYYVALRYFSNITGSETKRIELLTKGMDEYNRYLKRNLGFQINDTARISSKILSDSNTNINDQIESLTKSFESRDKLITPIRTISKLLGNENTDKLLVKVSKLEKFKNYSFVYGSMSGVIMGIISLVSS